MASAPPKTPADYLARAASCERVAESAVSPETREIMLYLARRWRAFADEADAKRRSPDQQTQPRPPGAGLGTHENRE
jgi:hypothetical protein